MDDLDLVADINAQDDDGLGWSTLADAIAPDGSDSGRCCSLATAKPKPWSASWPSTRTVRSTSRSCLARCPRTAICSTKDRRIGDVVALLWGVSEVHDTIAEV